MPSTWRVQRSVNHLVCISCCVLQAHKHAQSQGHSPRRRTLVGQASAPLAVSGPRGVAVVFQSSGTRASVFDLEEDEGREEEGVGDEGEESEEEEEEE